jgi:hypothetical protein
MIERIYTGNGLFELGKESEFPQADKLEELERNPETRKFDWQHVWNERPIHFPYLPSNRVLVVEMDQLIHKLLYACATLDGLQWLWDRYAEGLAIEITYYSLEWIKEDFALE